MPLPFICRRCLIRPFTRTLTTSSPSAPPPATSTSAAQPFSTPFTPSPPLNPLIPDSSALSSLPSYLPTHGVLKNEGARESFRAPSDTRAAPIRSSVPAGTPLKGLGYLKAKETPVALEDHEYPAWLWELDTGGKKREVAGGEEGDAFAKSKKQRRLAAKSLRKTLAAHPEALEPKIPMEHQSIDLEAGDGTVGGNVRAVEEREELRSAMRSARRKKIKEGNFLKTM